MEVRAMVRRRKEHGPAWTALQMIPTNAASICDMPQELLVYFFLLASEKHYLALSEVCAHWYHIIMHAQEFNEWRYKTRVTVFARNLSRHSCTRASPPPQQAYIEPMQSGRRTLRYQITTLSIEGRTLPLTNQTTVPFIIRDIVSQSPKA